MPNQDIPENKVQKESGKANIRTLHRKFLLLFISISDNLDIESPKQPDKKKEKIRQRKKDGVFDDNDYELSFMPVLSKGEA